MEKKTDQYEAAAESFLKDTGSTLTAYMCPERKTPLWATGKKDEKHGINYTIWLVNARGSYTFDYWGSIRDKELLDLAVEAKARGKYSREYTAVEKRVGEMGASMPTLAKLPDIVRELIMPNAYDVLACLSPLHEDDFAAFCSYNGYSSDSIRALKIFEACKEQDRQLRRLFTHAELETLESIS